MATTTRGDSAGGTLPRPQVKTLLPAPALPALQDRRFFSAGPRRILATTLVLAAFVTAAAAGLRLAADPLLRADLFDLVFVPQPLGPLRLTAIGVALLVGVATLAFLSRSARR